MLLNRHVQNGLPCVNFQKVGSRTFALILHYLRLNNARLNKEGGGWVRSENGFGRSAGLSECTGSMGNVANVEI